MSEELSRSDEHRLEKALKAATLENYPNPNRIGCPSDKNVLRLLAALKLRPSDPVVQHVAECSPCLAEVLEYRRALKRKRLLAEISLAAIILIICATVFWINRPTAPLSAQIATIDLRPFAVTRGAAEASAKPPSFSLRRGKLNLTILLPVGAEEGPYEFKLLNDSLQTVRSGTAQAIIRNYVTTISTELDTSGLSPGRYSFWLRQPNREWESYEVSLR